MDKKKIIIGASVFVGLAIIGLVIYRCTRKKKPAYEVPDKSPAKVSEGKDVPTKTTAPTKDDEHKSSFNGKEKLKGQPSHSAQSHSTTTASQGTVAISGQGPAEKKK